VVGLRETIEAYTDLPTCLASLRERTPTEVSEAVADLHYDAFFEDVCGSMRAIREASVPGCDELSVSSAQRGCRLRLAIFHGEPTACPSDRVAEGREPVCVAWAARDEDLCAAASAVDRARCRAVLSADPARCSRARGGDRVRCEAEIERYASALEGARRESPAARRRRELRLDVDGVTLTRDTLQRGVRLVNEGCRTRVALARPIALRVIGPDAGSFSLTFSLASQIELPEELSFGASDALLEVNTERRGQLSSTAGARGGVTLSAFERRLGGEVSGTLEGELGSASQRIPVRGRFTTFVRDLDPLDEACQR